MIVIVQVLLGAGENYNTGRKMRKNNLEFEFNKIHSCFLVEFDLIFFQWSSHRIRNITLKRIPGLPQIDVDRDRREILDWCRIGGCNWRWFAACRGQHRHWLQGEINENLKMEKKMPKIFRTDFSIYKAKNLCSTGFRSCNQFGKSTRSTNAESWRVVISLQVSCLIFSPAGGGGGGMAWRVLQSLSLSGGRSTRAQLINHFAV